MGQSRPLFVYLRPFHTAIQLQIENVLMLCLGFEPGTQDLRLRPIH